jgi:uncharacterized BrkB/YihY/UPF0761 family membrane protein
MDLICMNNQKHWGVARYGFLIFGLLTLLATLVFQFLPATKPTSEMTLLVGGLGAFFTWFALSANDELMNIVYHLLWKHKLPR